jgi:hypothetical protein
MRAAGRRCDANFYMGLPRLPGVRRIPPSHPPHLAYPLAIHRVRALVGKGVCAHTRIPRRTWPQKRPTPRKRALQKSPTPSKTALLRRGCCR